MVTSWCSSVIDEALRERDPGAGVWVERVCMTLVECGATPMARVGVRSGAPDLEAVAVRAADPALTRRWRDAWRESDEPPDGVHGTARFVERIEGRAGSRSGGSGSARVDGGGGDLGELTLEAAGAEPGWVASAALRDAMSLLAPVLSRIASRVVIDPLRRRRRLLEGLGPVQRRLVPMLVEGKSEREIAETIGRSRHTVHDHTKRIYRAFGVHTRVELAARWNGTMVGTDGEFSRESG